MKELEEFKEGKVFKEKIYKQNLSFETASLEYNDEIKKKLLRKISQQNIKGSNSQKQFIIKIVEANP